MKTGSIPYMDSDCAMSSIFEKEKIHPDQPQTAGSEEKGKGEEEGQKESEKKTIAIVATGGTIAGSGRIGESVQYEAGTLPVDSIVESIPQIRSLANLKMIPICSKDSNDISYADILAVREQIEAIEADPQIAGTVITHGTDTLEETAFFLNLILNVRKPVIMTGAMRPATATSADGPMNLYQSVALAASDQAAGMGVLAVLSDTIYSGRDLTKINSIKTDAFEVGDPGPIGYMRDQQAYLIHSPYRRHTHYSRFAGRSWPSLPAVEIFYVHADCDPALLCWMLDHYAGVVIAGSGSGNYPHSIQEVIEAYRGPCVMVRTSRLLEGGAFASPVFDPKQKTIAAHRLSPHKARILLMLGLADHLSHEELQRLFCEY